jgi:signal peptidase I
MNSQQQTPKPSTVDSIWEVVRFAIIALAIVIPIRAFVAQPFVVSGSSMAPTFENGEYLIVDQISYNLGHPHRGDVAIFRYPEDPSKFFIKRVIGLPSETVIIDGSQVTIVNENHPEGLVLNEDYVEFSTTDYEEITLADDEYFVMGDNRAASLDSREWGPLPEDHLTGKALLRLLPTPAYKPGAANPEN